jgi:hypothetical protein
MMFYLKWFVVSVEYLGVGTVSKGVVALINNQEVDIRHREGIAVQGIEKHLMYHDQYLRLGENFLGTSVRN